NSSATLDSSICHGDHHFLNLAVQYTPCLKQLRMTFPPITYNLNLKKKMPVNWLTDWHYSYEDVFKSPLNSVQSFYKYCMKDDDSLANARLYAVRLLQNGNVSSHCPGSKPESVSVCHFHLRLP